MGARKTASKHRFGRAFRLSRHQQYATHDVLQGKWRGYRTYHQLLTELLLLRATLQLVGHAGSSVIHRAPLMSQGKAHTAGNGRPFPRGATQHWLISDAPLGQPTSHVDRVTLARIGDGQSCARVPCQPGLWTGCELPNFPHGPLAVELQAHAAGPTKELALSVFELTVHQGRGYA